MSTRDSGRVSEDVIEAQVAKRLGLVRNLMRALKAVAPFSLAVMLVKGLAYLSGHHKHLFVHKSSRLITLFNLFVTSEGAFAVYCAVHKHKSQSFLEKSRRPPARDVAHRREVFDRCLNTVARPKEFATKWLRDYSLEEIRMGNIQDWLSWGMFNKKHSALSQEEHDELEGYTRAFQERVGLPIKDGHNGNIRCYKFDHEPVESLHRPLVYYGFVHGFLQRVCLPLALLYQGFGGLRPSRSFNYFVRKAKRTGPKPPVVLIHGIGIGPLPYVKLVADIVSAVESGDGPDRTVFVLELPAVAQQLFPADLLPHHFVQDIKAMLGEHGHDQACFVGHSYGTFTLSWIAKCIPECAAGLAFLDPVPFLLHDSTVLRAIVYKEAQNEAEELFKYFLRAEMFFNSHTRRHFMWQENLLFFEQIPASTPTLLVLSENDDIVYVDGVLNLYKETAAKAHIELLYLPNTIHGGLLFGEEEGQEVARRVVAL